MCQAVRFRLEQAARRSEAAAKSYVFREPARWVRERQQTIDEAMKSLDVCLAARVDAVANSLTLLRTRLSAVVPPSLLREMENRISDMRRRLHSVLEHRFEARRSALTQRIARLDSVNPMTVVRRGYAILVDPKTKRIVTSPDTPQGTRLTAWVTDGVLDLELKSVRRGKTSFQDLSRITLPDESV
jgi:exodeoxyribonuclease VII large subunit